MPDGGGDTGRPKTGDGGVKRAVPGASVEIPYVEIPDIDSLPPIRFSREEIPPFPFSALVSQSPMKQAVLVVLANPEIRSAVLFGDTNCGKATAMFSARKLLPLDTPFVEMPLSVTGFQLFGGEIKRGNRVIKSRGLVGEAMGGYLVVERLNLFDDDTITKIVRLAKERGFTILATANREDGDFPPEIWDLFEVAVSVNSVVDIEERIEILKRVEEYRRDPFLFYQKYAAQEERLKDRIASARSIAPRVEFSAASTDHMKKMVSKIKPEWDEKADRLVEVLKKISAGVVALDGRTWVEKGDVNEAMKLMAANLVTRL